MQIHSSWGVWETPENLLLPVDWEAHCTQRHDGVLAEEIAQPQMPTRIGRQLPEQVVEHHGHGEEAVIGEEKCLVPPGHLPEFDHELPVPQPGMMGAKVAHVGQDVKPTAQHELVGAEVPGNGDAFGPGAQAGVES